MKHILIILTVITAVILASAPGWTDPDWSSFEPPPPPDNQGWISFQGGRDGTATLWGRLMLPTKDGSSQQKSPPPVVVFGPGGGLSHDCQMSPFVDAFLQDGYAAFTFDYATFGASGNGNQPRHTIVPEQQVEDLKAAVATVRSHSKELRVDGDRIALWGVSLSGAHVLVAVSEDEGLPGVRAVCSLVPLLASGLDAIASTFKLNTHPFMLQAKMLALVLKGTLLGIVGRPWYLPFYALDGTVAVQQGHENNEGYASLAPPDGGDYSWRNGMAFASLFSIFQYQPSRQLKHIKLPVSLIAAANDTICLTRDATIASDEIEESEFKVLPDIGHFDIWHGETREKVLHIQLQFLQKHLLGIEASEESASAMK